MEDKLFPVLEGNPDWMSRLPEELHDVPLWNLALPGSHDTMSFCLDISSPVLRSESFLLRLTDLLLPCCTRPCIYRWATTQQSILADQGDLGIRFFDLRIAKNPASSSNLFFAHGIYTLLTVKEALKELAMWLEAHPKEIVIISCSHFDTMTNEDHVHLVEFIHILFNLKLCSSKKVPTLRSCWSKGQQVIISYDNEAMLLEHPELWRAIPYWYADTPNPKKVISYLETQKLKGRPAGFYVSGLNLTEDATYVALHPCQTMRKMTMDALPLLLRWTEAQQPGPEPDRINIVCCDFVNVSEFCSIVIGLNYKLQSLDSCY
uniref:Phosphatidylinositol-specific phospholipase C X domain-containing protein n=1 Tax=Oryzias latipes TaxID=8090 RepID=A0A3P9HF69_ORYLA